MAAEGRKPYSFHAIAGRRLEYLLRWPGGSKRNHQSVSRPEARRRPRNRSPDTSRARDGPEHGRGATHEHVFQVVSGPAGAFPMEVRADHSMRSDPDRQMVPRELLRDEFVEPLNVGAAGNY